MFPDLFALIERRWRERVREFRGHWWRVERRRVETLVESERV